MIPVTFFASCRNNRAAPIIPGVGMVEMFAGSTIPASYLPCNGAAISRRTYKKLFAIIGTTYGDGDGTTTFNVPDSRGLIPRFYSSDGTLEADKNTRLDRGDGTTGNFVGTKQMDELRAHNHIFSGLYGTVFLIPFFGGSPRWIQGNGLWGTSKTSYSGTALEARPINVYVTGIIRYE